MSEAKEGAKKGNKLPVIIAIVAVLAAGGYFMSSKGGGDKEKEEPEIALGHPEEVGEFLVNLSDGSTYLSTNITVHCAEGESVVSGGDGHGGKGSVSPAVQDAVIQVLTSKRLSDITSTSGKQRLKYELAYAMNHAYHASAHGEEDKGKKKKKKDEDHEEDHHGLEKDFHPENPQWDADEGPVLKIYFTSFTTQR